MAQRLEVTTPDALPEETGAEAALRPSRLDEFVGQEQVKASLQIAMDALNCPPGDSPVTNLSGGEKRRVALCKLLLEKPDLLLLDEPTNYLDAESVQWLERTLREYTGRVVLITHDRYFLDNCVGWILELDRGRGVPFEGNYTSCWSRSRSASPRRRSRSRPAAGLSPASSSGCA